MRPFLLCLLLTLPALGRAQAGVAAAAQPAVATQYCTLVATGDTYSGMQFQLDYGRQVKKYLSAPEAAEAQADQVALNNLFTLADALNFLASHGWECIGVSTITSSLSAPTTTGFVPRPGSTLAVGHSEVQYLLRRRGQ